MRTVLLFDIDGTLVSTGGAGRRAMVGAFANLHGKDDVFEGTSFAGMTDRAIARHGLRDVMAEITEAEIDRALDAYLALLEIELAKADAYRVLPGVTRLLESIAGAPDVAIGLGTGNVRRGAYAKLARGGIDGAFAFGGFGCDAESRVELLRAGARRGAERLGSTLESCRVVVIGDTPKDVAAAEGIGAPCVAVGTGGYALEELAACGAQHTFATLDDDGVRAALLPDV
ncbi:MAG: HAD hydrolase-like protein [Labilithrix sp.]|nr:HAD hydrolase-like protein [Labilithrix sp.]MBX3219607.1 HAD hydrolase-like protein [Labilithrix sp.]